MAGVDRNKVFVAANEACLIGQKEMVRRVTQSDNVQNTARECRLNRFFEKEWVGMDQKFHSAALGIVVLSSSLQLQYLNQRAIKLLKRLDEPAADRNVLAALPPHYRGHAGATGCEQL